MVQSSDESKMLFLGFVVYSFYYDFGICLYGGDRLDEIKRSIAESLKQMISLLYSHVCCENFPKHLRCFGRILGLRVWQPTGLLKVYMFVKNKTQVCLSYATISSIF